MVFQPRAGYHGLFIEFKKPGGKTSKVQLDMINRLETEGYECVVLDSTQAAIETVLEYLGEK